MFVEENSVARTKYRDGLGTVALEGGVSDGQSCASTWCGDGRRDVYDVRVWLNWNRK